MTRRRLQFLLLGSVAFATCLVAACADIFGVHSADFDGGGGTDGGGDAVLDVPFDYQGFDVIDFDVNTAMCGDGGVPYVSPELAVWVSAKTGSGTLCTQAQPCKTIAQGLANRGSRNVVYLDDSTFQEIVQLNSQHSGITLQGGWVQNDGGWQAVCASNKSIIQGQDGGPAAVEIAQTDNITLRLLTVTSKPSGVNGGGASENVYAIRAVDVPKLTLDNVTLISQTAGGGAPGTTPTTTSSCMQNGGSGQPGGSGNAGALGTFTGNDLVIGGGGQGVTGNTGTYTGPTGGKCGSCNTVCP